MLFCMGKGIGETKTEEKGAENGKLEEGKKRLKEKFGTEFFYSRATARNGTVLQRVHRPIMC